MKKFIFAMAMAMFAMLFAEQVTTTEWANLRSEHGMSGQVLAKVKPSTYEVIGTFTIYTKVTVDGKSGMIGSQLLDGDVVKGLGCVLRDLDGNEICKLSAGTKVVVVPSAADWYQITVNGVTGWIYKAQ